MDLGYLLTNAPWLSVLPPIFAIALALWKKEVYSSLFFGVVLAALLLVDFNPLKLADALIYLFRTMATVMGENGMILIFLCLLGVLAVLLKKSGGSMAYGNWAAGAIKSKRGVMLATSALGALIFVDDYFNCMTVGAVMRPVTDKLKISRVKLAYLIDATAAPICIIAPISSWALSVGSTIDSVDPSLGGFQQFVNSIPFNLYALLTIVFLVILSVTCRDFGKMKKFQQTTDATGDVFVTQEDRMVSADSDGPVSEKGRVADLLVPILVLIVVALFFMFYTGGLFRGVGFAEAMGNCDAYVSMVIGGFAAIVVALLLYLPRRLMTFREAMDSLAEGVKTMIPANLILLLAWTLVRCCQDLQTAKFINSLIESSGIPLGFLPAVIFVVAAALAFATGTSWGTFGILLTFVIPATAGTGTLFTVSLAATLAGAVCGDHISPISDTTILASTGAECNHLDHVKTQIPYALTVAAVCFVGYLIAGFTLNVWITLGISIALLPLALFLAIRLSESWEKRQAKTAEEKTDSQPKE